MALAQGNSGMPVGIARYLNQNVTPNFQGPGVGQMSGMAQNNVRGGSPSAAPSPGNIQGNGMNDAMTALGLMNMLGNEGEDQAPGFDSMSPMTPAGLLNFWSMYNGGAGGL